MTKTVARPEPGARGRYKIDTRERILGVAEELFSEKGFSGTSMRQIAKKAGVNIALAHYHFGSKSDLFVEVYLRCGNILKNERGKMLDAAERVSGGDPVPLEEVIKAFFVPALHMMEDDKGRGQNYIRLVSRLHNEPAELARQVLTKVFDASTVRFVNAIQKTLPDLPPQTVYWRLCFMMGVFMFTVSGAGRLEVISKGQCTSADTEMAIKQVLPFLIAGFNAPSPV